MGLRTDEQNLIEFIHGIPPEQNPYLAVIGYLEQATKPPPLPTWARVFLQVIMAFYVVMWLQCFYLLYVRFRTGTFRLITVTRLGLWRVDVPNMSGLAYFIFPPLVIADLVLQLLIDRGRDLHNKIPLLAGKFLVLLTASWAFLWVCACQCLTTYWDSKWSAVARRGERTQLPRFIVISMNSIFVCVLSWIIPCLLYFMYKSNNEYEIIRKIFRELVTSLKSLGATYDQATYQESTLLVSLLPARQMLIHEGKMANFLRTGLIIGLGDLLVMCLLYAPFLKNSIGAIHRRTAECTFEVATASQDFSQQFAHIKHRVKQEYWTSLLHGLAVYATALTFIPVLAWQVSLPASSIMRNRTWIIVTQLGMHGPFAISGNIIELLLNLQARRLLETHRIQQNVSTAVTQTANSQLPLQCSSDNSLIFSDHTPEGPMVFAVKDVSLKRPKFINNGYSMEEQNTKFMNNCYSIEE